MHIPRITRLTAAICLLAVPALAAPWHIYSNTPVNTVPSPAYWGFPFELQVSAFGGVMDITTVNGFLSPEYCDPANDYDGSGINVHTPTTDIGVQAGLVGKVLLNTSTQLFQDPRSGQRYFGAMYYDTQQHYTCGSGGLPQPCSAPNSKSIAYTTDGSAFTSGQQIMAECTPAADGHCYGSDWRCDHGFPCDTHYPRAWWTTGDMSVLRAGNAFYAMGWTAYYNYPGQPLFWNPSIWTYTSADGNTWQPYLQVTNRSRK